MTDKMIVDFWFDPSCPYTWVTSRWMVEVEKVRPLTVRWRVMSLSVLNEDRDDDPEGDPEGYLWVPARICAAVQAEYGHERLGRLYTAMWTTGRDHGSDWLGPLHDALAAAELPPALAGAGQTTDHDEVLRASHSEAMAAMGGESGTPVVAVDGTAFFGPVISRVPRGEQAGRLWDGTLMVAGTPAFHELRGRPHEEPQIDG
jgi:2-hydroxychromene-2-carboxylate isomerase